MKYKHINSDYLRTVLFGFEDGLVSTTGVVIGISAGAPEKRFIMLAALVTIMVEALSMAAGEFLSEQAVHELEPGQHHDSLILGTVLMFFAYFSAGMIPVLPFILLPLSFAIPVAILAALGSLFLLGYVKGRLIKVSPLRSGWRVLLVGGLATLIGLIVGYLLKI